MGKFNSFEELVCWKEARKLRNYIKDKLIPKFPVEEKYSYRIGRWEFKSTKGILIAVGEYDEFDNKIWDRGACEYVYIENSIAVNNWQFWDLLGNEIEPNNQQIDFVNFKVKKNDSITEYLTPGYKL